MSVLDVLGIARAGRALAALAVVASITTGAGVWVAIQWDRGQRAQADVASLRESVRELRTATADLRDRAIAVVQDVQTSALRMNVIAGQYQEQTDALDELFAAQRAAFESGLAQAVAPDDLRDCRIGAFGMRVWADAANGLDGNSPAATGADPSQPADRLPADPPGAGRRLGPDSAAHLDAGCAAVPPLPCAAATAD